MGDLEYAGIFADAEEGSLKSNYLGKIQLLYSKY